ncbi:MAG TPA: ferritin-like domain-containing protein [Planctomycetota bacterium]|nr:ferritin-like domain-containing protein [Planctomycetota bacterium]
MENEELADQLESLLRIDVDASHAYKQTIEEIDVQEIREQLTQFRGDHERHIAELSKCIQSLGQEPPKAERDFRGYLIAGFTAIRAKMGIESALKAMHSNEKLTNKTYAEAMKWNASEDIHKIIARNYEDEKRHLNYIEQALNTKAWKVPVGEKH